MTKKDLMTIKEFAKLTGVRTHVLRYYDSLGILPPAYVDPNSGYRFYFLYQCELIFTIQMCVEAGISLKEFSNYLSNDSSVIRYEKLIAYVNCRLVEQIQKLQNMLNRIKMFSDVADVADTIHRSGAPCRVVYPEMNCLMIPYPGKQSGDRFQKYAKLVIQAVPQMNYLKFIGSGLLLRRKDEGEDWEQLLFGILLDDPGPWRKDSRFFTIPAGEYLCREVPHSGIEQVWEWSAPYVDAKDIELALETELFVNAYNYVEPPLEQRCLLRKHKHGFKEKESIHIIH